jgi:hypothetical protein
MLSKSRLQPAFQGQYPGNDRLVALEFSPENCVDEKALWQVAQPSEIDCPFGYHFN